MTIDDAVTSLRAYADRGRPTGGFLEAVLSNDLMDAIGRADESSLTHLAAICRYVYNELPAGCWGSKARVENWIRAHGAARAAAAPYDFAAADPSVRGQR